MAGSGLVVPIEVTVARMERDLQKVMNASKNAAKSVENTFTKANSKVVESFEKTSRVMERINKMTGVTAFDTGAVSNFARILDGLEAKYNPVVAAAQRYRSQLSEINTALANNILSQSEHAAATLRVKASYDAEMASISRTNAALEEQYGIRTKINQNLGIGAGGSNSAEQSASAFSSELDILRAKFDPIFAASRRYETSLSEITQAHKLGALSTQQMESAIERLNAEYTDLAASQHRGLQQANLAERGVKRSGFAVANLSAQLNDIGVSLAGGQSPFQVMIQQGTQVSQIFQQTGGDFKTFSALLKGSILGVVNPFSIATFAMIGLGGAALQWALSTEKATDQAKEALDKHISDIKRITQAWGDTVPALKGYLDELELVKQAGEIKDTYTEVIKEQWVDLTGQLDELAGQLFDAERLMNQFGRTDAATKLGQQYEDLTAKIKDNSMTTEDATKMSEELMSLYENTGLSLFQALSESFKSLSDSISVAADETQRLRKEQEILLDQEVRRASVREQFLNRFREGMQMVPMTDDLSARMASGDLKQEKAKMTSRSPRSNTDRYEDTFERRQLSLKTLLQEIDAQSKLNPLVNDYGFALEYAKVKQELLNEAQAKNVKLTPEQVDAIDALAKASANASVTMKTLSEAQDKFKSRVDSFRDTTRSAMEGFIQDIRNSTSLIDALGNALDKIADKLLNMTFDMLFTGGNGDSISRFLSPMFAPRGGNVSPLASAAIASGAGGLYDKGGFTGRGGDSDIAGAVHKNEFVFDAMATRRIGVPALLALQKGYKNGGFVGSGVGGRMGGDNIKIYNNASDKSQVSSAGRDSTGALKIVIDAVKDDMRKGGFRRVLPAAEQARVKSR